MTAYELTSLIYEIFRDMDSMMEFWISATFAVVVAVFVAREHLSRAMLMMILGLYVAASVMFALRWVVFLRRTFHYREELIKLTGSDIPTDDVLVGVIVVLIISIFMLGIGATSYFLHQKEKP